MTQTATAATAASDTSAPDLRAQLFAAQAWYADLVATVRDDQRGEPTPCPDYDVRALLAHMDTVNQKITGFAREHRDVFSDHDLPVQQRAGSAEVYASEHIDGHSAATLAGAVRAESAAAQQVWTDDVLDTPIQLGWGPILPGRVVTAIYVMEVLTHAWDLATATGQPSEAPDGLGHVGLAAAQSCLPDEMPRGIDKGVPFGPKVESASDAGPTEAMVNWTGRASR